MLIFVDVVLVPVDLFFDAEHAALVSVVQTTLSLQTLESSLYLHLLLLIDAEHSTRFGGTDYTVSTDSSLYTSA